MTDVVPRSSARCGVRTTLGAYGRGLADFQQGSWYYLREKVG